MASRRPRVSPRHCVQMKNALERNRRNDKAPLVGLLQRDLLHRLEGDLKRETAVAKDVGSDALQDLRRKAGAFNIENPDSLGTVLPHLKLGDLRQHFENLREEVQDQPIS